MLVAVTIREELARTVVVDVPEMGEYTPHLNIAEDYVESLWKDGEIELTSDNFVDVSYDAEEVDDIFLEGKEPKPDYTIPKDWGKK